MCFNLIYLLCELAWWKCAVINRQYSYCIVLYCAASRRVGSRRVGSGRVGSGRVVSCRVVSCRVVLYGRRREWPHTSRWWLPFFSIWNKSASRKDSYLTSENWTTPIQETPSKQWWAGNLNHWPSLPTKTWTRWYSPSWMFPREVSSCPEIPQIRHVMAMYIWHATSSDIRPPPSTQQWNPPLTL